MQQSRQRRTTQASSVRQSPQIQANLAGHGVAGLAGACVACLCYVALLLGGMGSLFGADAAPYFSRVMLSLGAGAVVTVALAGLARQKLAGLLPRALVITAIAIAAASIVVSLKP